jgi:hypothetical protein
MATCQRANNPARGQTHPHHDRVSSLPSSSLFLASYRGMFWIKNPRLIHIAPHSGFFTFNLFDAQAWLCRDVILGRHVLPALETGLGAAESRAQVRDTRVTHPPTCSLTHTPTHPPTHPLTRALTHSPTHSAHSLAHSLAHTTPVTH